MSAKPNTYHASLDLLKVIAILAVILLHITSLTAVAVDQPEADFVAGNVLFAVSHFGVPIFVMVSGALLLGREYESIGAFYRKRLTRVLIPLLLWSMIYFLYRYDVGALAEFPRRLFQANISGHLWFIYMIMMIYLAAPFLNLIVQAGRRYMEVFLLLWVLIVFINPSLDPLIGYSLRILDRWLTIYTGYFVLGYYLYSLERPFNWRLLFAGIAIVSVVISVGTLYTWEVYGEQVDYYWGNHRPLILLLAAVLIFLLFKQLHIPERLHGLARMIGGLVFGVYLVHIIVRNELWRSPDLPDSVADAAGTLLIFSLTVLISFVIAWILKRIPLLRILVP